MTNETIDCVTMVLVILLHVVVSRMIPVDERKLVLTVGFYICFAVDRVYRRTS